MLKRMLGMMIGALTMGAATGGQGIGYSRSQSAPTGSNGVYVCPSATFRPHWNQRHKRRGGTHGSTRGRRFRAAKAGAK